MKRPSFQMYPSDWLRDTALRTCSLTARGLWMDMICFMHQGAPYGHLKVNNKVILPINLAQMVGGNLEEIERLLLELEDAGVFSRTEDGTIYSKRMVKDEHVRNLRSEGGKLGGNPKLLTKKDNLLDKKKDIQKTTPSSSSSSSSTNNILSEFLTSFNEARILFPGKVRGNETEFNEFQKKHNDWKVVVPILLEKIQGQIFDRQKLASKGQFVPQWKNFKTWLNQRCWEEETKFKKEPEFIPNRPATMTKEQVKSLWD